MPGRLRVPLVQFSGLLLLASATTFAMPAGADLRLRDFFLEAGSSPGPSRLQKSEGMGQALQNLLGDRGLPIPCATSLLLELRRNRDFLPLPTREAFRVLMIRPELFPDEAYQTRDGRFTIHYSLDRFSPDGIEARDADLNGVPDRVDQIADVLDRSTSTLGGRLGWPLPSPGARASRYDVYLINLGPLSGGLTVPEREAGIPRDEIASHIVIDSRLDEAQLPGVVAHQFAHASLLTLSARAPIWWSEATAAWLETSVTRDPAPQRAAISLRLERSDLTLTGDSLLLSLGNLLWTSFLADREEGGAERVRQIWMEESLHGSEPAIGILDDVLRRGGGQGVTGAFREFTRWMLFTGQQNDGDHFRLGGLFPPLTPRATHAVFPAESAGLESVEPLGAAIYRFVGDGSRGGLRIRFEAEAPTTLEVDLVVTPSTGGRRPHLVELALDGEGHAEIGIPWREALEAVMIVRNGSLEGETARFRYSAQMDPLFPYDLSSFTAAASRGGITLQWATGREIDLLGWNVHRSSSPTGPFLRMNPVALPSGGDSTEETNYIYQDATATDGRRYFYLLEAITIQGLSDRTFPLSARALKPESTP